MTRPVFLNLLQIKFPVTAIVSILHRVTGVAVFAGMPFFFFWFYMVSYSDLTLQDAHSVAKVWWVQLIYILLLSALSYHVIAGLRHVYMDFFGSHSLVSARIAAWITLLTSLFFAVLFSIRIIF